MRKMILALAILYPAAAFAQGTTPPAAPANPAPPPTVGGKPLSPAQKLQACQDIDDATKERLSCYDGVFAPQPKPKPAAAKGVNDCRFLKEEDERLTCFNRFVDKIPQLPR